MLGAELLKAHRQQIPYSELARQYQMTPNEVKGLIRTARLKTPGEFDICHYGTPFAVVGDAVVVGDVHVPATDWDWACRVARVAERTKISTLIIAGDFFDFAMWSSFKTVVPPATWHQERDAARVLLSDWLEVFTDIYTITGNHDRRLMTWTAGELDEADIWGMVNTSTKLHNSILAYMTLRSGGQLWHITHPRNYSRQALVLAGELALKHDCHVISAHEHHSGMSHDVYGRHNVINIGTLADPRKFAYVYMDDSRAPAMVKSFCVVKNGYPTLYDEGLTDWTGMN